MLSHYLGPGEETMIILSGMSIKPEITNGNRKEKYIIKNVINKSDEITSKYIYIYFLFMHFCPGTITTHAESINSDLQRGLDRRLRHIQH